MGFFKCCFFSCNKVIFCPPLFTYLFVFLFKAWVPEGTALQCHEVQSCGSDVGPPCPALPAMCALQCEVSGEGGSGAWRGGCITSLLFSPLLSVKIFCTSVLLRYCSLGSPAGVLLELNGFLDLGLQNPVVFHSPLLPPSPFCYILGRN